jgi:hypothetical protein
MVMDYLDRNLKMNKQTADFLETLEGLLTVLEERAKTDMMTMGEFRGYITEMLEQHYKSRYDD